MNTDRKLPNRHGRRATARRVRRNGKQNTIRELRALLTQRDQQLHEMEDHTADLRGQLAALDKDRGLLRYWLHAAIGDDELRKLMPELTVPFTPTEPNDKESTHESERSG